MANPEERSLFVETTIPIWRRTKPKEVQRRIARTLNGRRPISSTYVKAEYTNTYIRAAVDLYNVIVDSEDLDDARGRWETHWSGSIKDLGWQHLLSVMAQGETERESLLRRLRQLIEVSLPLLFDQTAPELIDATHCEAAHIRPYYNGTAYELSLEFPPREAPTGLRDFLDNKRNLLERLERAIASADADWKKVTDSERIKSSLPQILAGKYNLGGTSWRRLSDIVIALEAHDCNSEIYTGNVKDYRPICDAIDLPMKPEYVKPPTS